MFDAIVVGAGPAGSSAALAMARAGLEVALIERGEYPGAKNVSGAALYAPDLLSDLLPDYWEEAPLERYLTRRVVTFLGKEAATSPRPRVSASCRARMHAASWRRATSWRAASSPRCVAPATRASI